MGLNKITLIVLLFTAVTLAVDVHEGEFLNVMIELCNTILISRSALLGFLLMK